MGLREERKEGTKWSKSSKVIPRPMFTQDHPNSNRPCPLLAIFNVLVGLVHPDKRGNSHLALEPAQTAKSVCLEVFLLITLGKMDASIKQLGETWHISSSVAVQQLVTQVGLAVGGWRPAGIPRSSGGGGGRGRGLRGWFCFPLRIL